MVMIEMVVFFNIFNCPSSIFFPLYLLKLTCKVCNVGFVVGVFMEDGRINEFEVVIVSLLDERFCIFV